MYIAGCLATQGTNLFASAVGGVFRSTDNGATWTFSDSRLTNRSVSALLVSGTSIFAGTLGYEGGGGVFLSTDDGTSWSAINSGLTSGVIHSLVTNGSSLFAGTTDGVFRSTDNGSNWTKPSAIPFPSGIECLALCGTDLYAGTHGSGVFLSVDDGMSWTQVNNGMTNHSLHALMSNGTILFAATEGGIFLSANKGTSWTSVSTGLKDTYICSLDISNNTLFAGTSGNGVWRRPLSEMTSVDRVTTDLPAKFSLGQNYPNPFNPVTTISIGLPCRTFVQLKIFDALGRQVSVLLSEQLTAGTHARQWNAAGLPSGVYFYRIQAGDYTEGKKLLLLK
jgi:hypothetical protein